MKHVDEKTLRSLCYFVLFRSLAFLFAATHPGVQNGPHSLHVIAIKSVTIGGFIRSFLQNRNNALRGAPSTAPNNWGWRKVFPWLSVVAFLSVSLVAVASSLRITAYQSTGLGPASETAPAGGWVHLICSRKCLRENEAPRDRCPLAWWARRNGALGQLLLITVLSASQRPSQHYQRSKISPMRCHAFGSNRPWLVMSGRYTSLYLNLITLCAVSRQLPCPRSAVIFAVSARPIAATAYQLTRLDWEGCYLASERIPRQHAPRRCAAPTVVYKSNLYLTLSIHAHQLLPPWDASKQGVLSFKFRTNEPNGLIILNTMTRAPKVG